MWMVSIALTPSALWGVYSFGFRALLVLAVSIGTAVLSEYLVTQLARKSPTLWDGSAFLTGLLVGMNMSPRVALFIPVLASLFAILVVKWTFGGLGANWANPALGGRVFVFFSFTSAMSTFQLPRCLQRLLDASMVDSLSGATPLTYLKTRTAESLSTSSQLLASGNYPVTGFAQSVGQALHISPYTVDSFFGNVGGCIGEVSTLLLLLGGIVLILSKVITWHIPVSFIGTVAILNWIFGGMKAGLGVFHGEILMPLVSGGLFLGAFFMATDYVTSPITHKGQLVFGFGCGFFTFLLRNFGALPEAVSVSILLMNIVTPTIDRYIKNRKFGEVVKQPKKEAKA